MAEILVIDDDEAFREGLTETLEDLGHHPKGVASGAAALRLLEREKFDVIFLDFRLPGLNGLEVLPRLQEKLGARALPIIIITAFTDSVNTIEAMKLGAFDHLTKPVGRTDIARVLESALRAYPPQAEPLAPRASSSETMIAKSPAMREVLKMIGRLAANDSSVLITGETGTGKEVVAHAIHANSARAAQPMIAVNCAAIPEALLESELFGHVKGAFTGATTDRRGSFQQADGGTLFLDEIGDMDRALQAKLLRALQEREITPVGSSRAIKVNVRILAATHQDLAERVRAGEFREDLLYRIQVVELHLPPLRERREDIEPLAHFFLSRLAQGSKSITPEALRRLEARSWPGNVRELKNVIERAVALARGPRVDLAEIAAPSDPLSNDSLNLPEAVAQLEESLIRRALSEAAGNRSEAARRLGIQRQLLYTKMKDYGIEDAP